MLSTLLTFTWNMPQGIEVGSFTLRFYSLLFALGFFVGYLIMKRIFQRENIPIDWLDSLLTYVVIATIIGARLGHVFFYEWAYYSQHPGEILKVWEGGLASHGAAVAIILALIIYSKRVSKKSVLWILDRTVITIALAGCFIRLGNMANSEIYGAKANSSIETVYLKPAQNRIINTFQGIADVSFTKTDDRFESEGISYPIYTMAVTFVPNAIEEYAKRSVDEQIPNYLRGMHIDNQTVLPKPNATSELTNVNNAIVAHVEVLGVPRYPTQVIEAMGYLLIFILLFTLFKRTDIRLAQGRIFGLFLVTVFGFRFFVEFYKANQVAFESDLQFNMGQNLSIPLVALGLFFIFKPKYIKAESEVKKSK
ncbi:MAG: prolipoprotein diacylglyceryl transferase [Cryomorphaceae bacterium]|nr:prolipoprotein diacylglyceryl transferase [Cryomorphaceae bacterium]